METHDASKLNDAGGVGINPDSAIPRQLSVGTVPKQSPVRRGAGLSFAALSVPVWAATWEQAYTCNSKLKVITRNLSREPDHFLVTRLVCLSLRQINIIGSIDC